MSIERSVVHLQILKKTEKDTKLNGLDPQEIASASLADTRNQVPMLNAQLQELSWAMTSRELCFFIEHLQDTFVALYKECSSIKEKYWHFQVKWLQNCSCFLVTNNSALPNLALLPQNPAADKGGL